jgi:hypothetical protein
MPPFLHHSRVLLVREQHCSHGIVVVGIEKVNEKQKVVSVILGGRT